MEDPNTNASGELRVKIPLEDMADGVLRFGRDAVSRRLGLGAAVLGAASMAWLVLTRPLAAHPWAVTGFGLLVAAGILVFAWTDTTTLNTRNRSVLRVRGFGPVARRHETRLTECCRLSLEVSSRADLFGEERIHRSLFLEGIAQRLPLFEGWDSPRATEMADMVAVRLGWPAPSEAVVPSRHHPLLQRGVTFGVWGVAAAVILVLGWQGWPSLRSAGRPLPPGMFRFSRGGSWEGPYERGSYLYRIGEFRQAEKEFRRSLELLPANPEALNMLAYALAEQKRVEEALKVALKALDRAPNSWMIIDTVAEMHQRSGAFAAAAAYYRRALRYPEARQVSETSCKYGETLLALGNRAEAIRQFQIAADNFEPPWAERARAHLQRLGVQSPFPTRARGMQAAPLEAPAVQ